MATGIGRLFFFRPHQIEACNSDDDEDEDHYAGVRRVHLPTLLEKHLRRYSTPDRLNLNPDVYVKPCTSKLMLDISEWLHHFLVTIFHTPKVPDDYCCANAGGPRAARD